ncbi:hypothetical protein FSP39_007850 [Pinctada imbricata]|uniref:RING-type E3 ubiquitin transferase n=1 Tax=Pinctada imbricata TaxID=66713 RepID=A0AA88YL82_PINIB|nr:hypothetical protein FSP39_007850 [Pinctada imbricata]
MSDSDSDLPDLVESSDEEPTNKKKKHTSSDHAKVWLEKSGKFLDRQENSIRVFALGPFLFGISTFLPSSWMKRLKDAKLLRNDERERSLAGLDWDEWSMVDIVETVVSVMQRKLRRRLYLVSCLDLIKSIEEEKGAVLTKEILREAEKYENIIKLWSKCKKNPTCGKYEKETKFAVIYVAKLYSVLVLRLAEEGKDYAEDFKRNLRPKSGCDPSKFKNAGNEQYQCGNFETAADYYAKAALADPLNHIYFGNRGQSYFKLKKFSEALADGRRAVTLKPDWCKGHYRYAQAFYQLDKLDLAISVNRKGLQICQNLKGKNTSDNNLLDLEQQGKKFLQEREAKIREEKVRKILEDTDLASQFLEEDLPQEIRNLPSKKRVIKLTEALRALGDFPSSNGLSDVPDLISSDSSSEDEDDIIVKRTNTKPVKEQKAEPKKAEEKSKGIKPDIKKKEPVVRTTAKDNQYQTPPTPISQTAAERSNGKNSNKNATQKDSNTQQPGNKQQPNTQKLNTQGANSQPSNSQGANTQQKKGKNKKGGKSGSPAPAVNQPEVNKQDKSWSPAPVGGQQKVNKQDMPKKNPAKTVSSDTPEAKEFSRILKEGMELQCNGLYKNALTSYNKALEMTDKAHVKALGLADEQDFVSLKYAYGVAAISTGTYKNILEGIEKFNDIVENHQGVRFPMVYYGLGKAYVSLKRFSQAEEPLKQGLRMVETFGSPSMVITWPGTNTKMEESVPENLRNLLKNLIQETKFPPTPDAMCRYHDDSEEDRTVIYTDDPAFKGFVRMICQSHCVIEFHATCWRAYKLKYGDRTLDKDILDKPCPTPDCGMYIIKITIVRQDAHHKEIESDKDYKAQTGSKKKAPMKTPITNIERLQKKQEKRELKKQRKHQQKEESTDLIEDVTEMIEERDEKGEKTTTLQGATGPGNTIVTDASKEETEESLAKAEVSLLKKEDDKLQKYKGTSKKSKNKKKKEKATKSQVIQLDVNFTGDREKNLLTEHSAIDTDHVTEVVDRNFSVPSGLKKKVDKFEDEFRKQGDQHMTESEELDEITQNLFLLFEDMLNGHGPLHVEDTKLTSLCDDFPQDAKDKIQEAGGLSKFLKQSFRFGVIDEVVCLMKDAIKAQEISKARQNARQGLQTVEAPKPLVNPWKVSTGAKAPISLKTSSTDFPSLKNPPTVNLSESFAEKLGRSTPSKGISELDTFDDFSLTPAKTGGVAGLDDDFNISVPKTRSKMDDLDDIPVYKSKKKKEKKKKSYNMDDIDSFSDSEEESNYDGSVISDRESFSSELSSSRSNFLQGQGQNLSVKSGDNVAMTMSRSSSKSDVSEKSDLSDLAKPNKLVENSSSPSVARDRGFGPIGSPAMLDSKATFENTCSGISQPKPLKIPPGLATRQQLLVSTSDSSSKHADGESLNSLVNEVVNRIYLGKNVSQDERMKTYNQVLRDVISEYQRTGSLPTADFVLSQTAANTKPGTSGFDLSAIDQGRNKIANADQYMKSFYQKNTIDPYSAYKKPAVTINNSSSSVFPPASSSTNTYSFPSIHSNEPIPPVPPPPPLTLPVPATTSLTGQFPSIHSDPSFPFPSKSSGNIWSTNDASSIPNAFSLSTPQHEPSMKLPEKTSPFFSNLSIGTSLTQEDKPLTLSGYSDALLRKHQSVQVAPLCVSREVMTDPYEPYKEDIARMLEERNVMETQLKLAQKQIQELSEILTSRDQRNQAVETEYKNRLALLEKEKSLVQSENQLYNKELERINMDNKNKKAAETEYQKAIVTYKEKLLEIQRQQSEERKKAMQQQAELVELQKSLETYQKTSTEDYNRARNAEVEVLNVKMRTAVQMLERSQKEFLFYQHNLSGMIKKFEEENRTVTPSMQQSLEHYRHISMKCEETIIRIKTDFGEQIKQIQDGSKRLSELPTVFVPPPPPPPQLPPMMNPEPQMAAQGGVASLSSLAGGSVSKSEVSMPGKTVSSPANITSGGASTQATPKPLGLPAGLQQPKPLVPPQGMGTLPQRTYMGSRMMAPGNQAQGKNSFEKLVAKLQVSFPQYNRATFTQFIQKLRESRGGSLSGMTLDDIVSKVTTLIQELERKQSSISSQQLLQTNKSSPVPGVTEALPPKPLTPPTWATGQQTIGYTEVFEEEEDPCVICHEEMTPPTTVKLECNHRFHDECIRKWLKEQSTCPNCRIYALLPDEFPSLS